MKKIANYLKLASKTRFFEAAIKFTAIMDDIQSRYFEHTAADVESKRLWTEFV